MRRLLTTALLATLLGGCAVSPDETLDATSVEVAAIIQDAVDAVALPITGPWERPGLFLPCEDGSERLTQVVTSDDPPDLVGLHRALVEHLQAEGWELAEEFRTEGEGGDSVSVFLLRDGFEAIADLVRGSEGTGVDLEVISPCRTLR